MLREAAWFLAAAGLLAACTPAPTTAPAPELPALERPTTRIASPRAAVPVEVPSTVLVERGGTPGVYVLREGRARFRLVRTGPEARGRIEIVAGLSGGEELVAGDLDEVHDGSPIRPPTTPPARRR
jgi:hypothetical protein